MGYPPPDDAPPPGDASPPPGPPLPPQPSAGGGSTFGISAGLAITPAPLLPSQISAGAEASFQPVLPGVLGLIAALCGFQLPGFDFSISFSLELPPFPPSFLFMFALGLSCDLSDPIEAKFEYGGGRLPSAVPELDADFRAAA